MLVFIIQSHVIKVQIHGKENSVKGMWFNSKMCGCAGEQERIETRNLISISNVSEALLMLIAANGGIHYASTCFQ